MSRKVLVVDDEKLIVKGLRFSLEQDGMEVDCAYDGEEALEKAKAGEYDIILLDLMLPKMDGLEVCQQIREFSNVPIIMLTAKGEDMDKILGLEYGADDYVTKPFNILEVKARIKAIIRRAGSKQDKQEKAKTVEVGELKLDCEGRRVFISGKEINLTAKEFDVLVFFLQNPFHGFTIAFHNNVGVPAVHPNSLCITSGNAISGKPDKVSLFIQASIFDMLQEQCIRPTGTSKDCCN